MQVFIFMLLLIQSPDNLGHIPSVSPEMSLLGAPQWEEYYCCSQPFVYENLANGLGFSSTNSWMIADDFNMALQTGFIDRIELWAIYSSANCTGFNIQIRHDTGGAGPGSIAASTTSSGVSHTNTGYTNWGYTLWYTDVYPVQQLSFADEKYWLAMQTTGGAGAHYWLATSQTWAEMTYFSQNNGSTWSSSQATWGAPYEQFMILSANVALERDSWGAVKALFRMP